MGDVAAGKEGSQSAHGVADGNALEPQVGWSPALEAPVAQRLYGNMQDGRRLAFICESVVGQLQENVERPLHLVSSR